MNMELYEKVRKVPKEALKEIQAGRLKGKSDINPMWRIKTLTENFGICGIGWKYEITRQWLEPGANEEISAFCNINLYVKQGGEWSDAIPGNGGSSFVSKEKNGLYVSDECFKMALTDAISVACKALGFGADIYWNADNTKYSKTIHPDSKAALFPEVKPMSDDEFITLLAIQDGVLLAEKMDKAKADGIVANPTQLKTLRAKYKELEEMKK